MDKIKNEHIIAAIKEIEANPLLRKRRASSTYDLIYEGKDYPPKLVISIANKYATGKELNADEFSGGPNKPAFDLLTKEGFTIIEKSESHNFSIIKEYISKLKSGEVSAAQSIKSLIETNNFENNLKVLDEIFFNNKLKKITSRNYKDIVEYLKEVHKIKSGEYNDFNIWSASKTHLSKTNNKLIYKHDDLNKKVGFPDNGNGLYKSFLGEKNLIQFIINKFEKIDNNFLLFDENKINVMRYTDFNYKSFHKKTEEAGLLFSEKMVARFVASLCTKPFVICSGLSGSGKTKLAQAFVQWICETDEQYKIIPVGADWTNREPLLGFPNGLDEKKYVKPDSGTLDLIFNALKPENKNKPYFLILDEMNLSHVERYFADFLSIMESKDKIKLHSSDTIIDIDKDFKWPKNLFIIGTVNIDETTYMFSPKVLDRANVIEFRISEEDLKKYLDSDIVLDMDKFLDETKVFGLGSNMGQHFLSIANSVSNHTIDNKTIVLNFFKELQKAGAEFGYRSTYEINRLIAILNELSKDDKSWDENKINTDEFIDIAIMQKLLPKLHGSRNKLTRVLPILGSFCVNEEKREKIKEYYFDRIDEIDFKDDAAIIYKLSFEKICRMYKNAIENGYASYAEA